MSSFDLFNGRSDGIIMGCFGTILARSWYMADDPPSHSDLGAQLEWLCLLLSDPNKVRAAGLHAAYEHGRSQITNDPSALETLEQQNYNLQCHVTPTHRLPAEIMMEIFHIALDVGQLRTGLMHVCRRWYKIIEGMARLWASFNLGAGTTTERVQHLLNRAGTHPLSVKIDINKERNASGELHSSLAMAGSKASQWQTLKVTSLSQDEADPQSDHGLTSIQLQPMRQLRHLDIMEPVLSPLLRLLLRNVATEAVGKLVSMEIHSLPAIEYLFQPAHVSKYCSLTTFVAKVPKMRDPIDLLPHFMQLKVLDLTNLHLSIIDSRSPLPLAHTLHHLYLKAVSIQWMGGQVFSQLEDCTIIAPTNGPSLRHDVQLPACTNLHFENWNRSSVGQFLAPALDRLIVRSNAWCTYKGNEQVIQFVRAGLGMSIQPKSLSLSVVCKDRVLLVVLQMLPGLVELKLDLPRPSALGKHFFTGLLAKPENQETGGLRSDWRELFKENSTGWRCTVCPSLRVLELKYQRWLRPVYNDDFLPPLLALSWSRAKAATPLHLHVHYISSTNSLELWNPTLSTVNEVISCLRTLQHGHVTHLALISDIWNNAVHENALFVPFLYHLQILRLGNSSFTERQVLNVLPIFQELKELSLFCVDIPPLSCGFALPLVHTLQRLSLRRSTLAWMDGLVFTQLQGFEVDEHDWPEAFKRKVGMPACTHIVFSQHRLKSLPVLPSDFYLPLLDTFELDGLWDFPEHDSTGISALQRINAKRFKFHILCASRRLLELLVFKDEVEHLDLVIAPAGFGSPVKAAQKILTRIPITNHFTRKVACRNMKVLRLQFSDLKVADREQISQSCRQMMNDRRLAGYLLKKCYIWWNYKDWTKAPALSLVMENEGVRTEE